MKAVMTEVTPLSPRRGEFSKGQRWFKRKGRWEVVCRSRKRHPIWWDTFTH